MRISHISINYFRSIRDCSLSLHEITAIIGENNAGKTALLRALNSVFNWGEEERFFKDNTHQYAPRRVTKIILTFEDIPNKALYHNKLYGNKLLLEFSYSYGESKRRKTLRCLKAVQSDTVDDNFIAELKKDIDFIYIPANRGNSDLTWSDTSIYKKVLVEYSQYVTQSRDNASAQIERVGSSLRKSLFSKIEKELEQMSMLDNAEHYQLGYITNLDYFLFLDKVGIQIREHNQSYPVTEYGSGIQSLSVIALYRALAKIKQVNVVLGLEEPEINLHPHAQKKLIASIKNNRQDTEIQAIMTTHSTVMVDELDHEDIILARRVKDATRGFFTAFSQINNDFWTTYNLNEFKHDKFFKYKNSEFFFSKYIVVVESSTDAEVIRKLISQEIGEKIYYISILNLDGVKNLKYPYFLLKTLGFNFSMVVDMDFLTQYKNDALKKSRNADDFLPEYKNILIENNPVINDLFTPLEKQQLNIFLQQSYTSTFQYCQSKKVFPMQYCLEIDLVANAPSKAQYCRLFEIENDENANKYLLVDNCGAIKEPERVLTVFNALQKKEYPYSYKKIKNALCQDIINAL